MTTDPNMDPKDDNTPLERRNRAVGLALAVMVIVLFVVTYFRIKGLTP